VFDVRVMPLGEPVDYAELRAAVTWAQRSITLYGKTYPQPRLTRWYGDVPYVYSGLSWEAMPFPPLIGRIHSRVEILSEAKFNSVLCNLYRDGRDCVGWHADNEPVFGADPIVASASFGAAREFRIRRNDGTERRSIYLKDGDLLVMGRGMQRHSQHTLPRTSRPCGERINLTFRYAVAQHQQTR
jgi:alkylated DNA repair dioxygenase AlkB